MYSFQMRVSSARLLLVVAIIATGCGTASYTHDMTVLIDDPSGRLGAGSVEVSLFDPGMGSSSDWARKTMGTASVGAPYEGTLSTTRVRTFLSEDLPGQIVVALAIPAYEERGYFVASIAPDPKAEKTIVAPFVPYGGPRRSEEVRGGPGAAGEVAPLPVYYTSRPGEQGWQIAMRVELPQ